jgi:hypothetical protein
VSTLATHLDRPGTCAVCAYDLRATIDAGRQRCPECGADLHPQAVAADRERRFFRSVILWVTVVMTVGILIAALAMFVFRDYAIVLAPAAIFLLAPATPILIAVYGKHCLHDDPL